jgi:Tfp pilus assembly protein PilF
MGDSATFRAGRLQPCFIFLLAIACVVPILRLHGLGMDDHASAETHANLGLQFAQRGDLVHAEKELRQAAKLAPANPEILTSLGTVPSI